MSMDLFKSLITILHENDPGALDENKEFARARRQAKAFKVGDRVQFTGAKSDPKRGVVVIGPPLKPSQMKKGTVTGHSSNGLSVKLIWDGGKLNVQMSPGTLTKIKK